MTFRELCEKQVIQLASGTMLGRVDDVEFDPETAQIERFILFGKPRLLGLLGREESLYIPCNAVQRFGVDALLVTVQLPPETAPQRRWHWPWEK